jgi:uncharacterized membrane protein YcaP (DUF421 family)
MLSPAIGVGELLLRVAVVYAAVFLLLRMVGKKHVGELAPFDLVVLLLLSECVQNALIGDDKSLTGGLIAATALFGLNQLVGFAAWRDRKMERLLEGTPRFLVRHGQILKQELAREQITHSELMEALRREGCTSITNVRYAILERTVTFRSACARAVAGPAPLNKLASLHGVFDRSA